MAEYEKDLSRLGPLAPTALALLEYAKALAPGMHFLRKGALWVSEPNFVAFKVLKRSRVAVFTLYGVHGGFKKVAALPIHWAQRWSYWEFRLDHPRQLGAAVSYIATAFHLSSFKHKAKPQALELEKIL